MSTAEKKDASATSAKGRTESGGAAEGLGAAGTANLEKVREILFGAQIQEIDKRLGRIEEHLLKEVTNLREDTRQRLEALEQYINKEIESATSRIKAEERERGDALKDVAKQIKDLDKQLEKKTTQLGEQAQTAHRDLRQQLLDLSKTLRDEISRRGDELSASLAAASQELRRDKTDRSELARLLTDVAVQLSDDGMSGD